ncbi:MAG: DUF4365 domain-containing protein [Candidatus Xenobiia bacterium LiM19]
MELPKVDNKSITGNLGVNLVEFIIINDFHWRFREQQTDDCGIDAQIEIVENKLASGHLIAAQIKAGASYLKERTKIGFVYRGKIEHLNYWSHHSLPVVIILCDIENRTAYWQHVFKENIQTTKKGWKILIPYIQKLNSKYKKQLSSLSAYRSAFTTYENYFEPFTDPTKLFNHTLQLIGHKDTLEKLSQFVKSKKKIALLWGRGGSGKSKILYEFSNIFTKKYSKYELRFLKDSMELNAEMVHRLPQVNCVVIIDDAHRREDLRFLFDYAQSSDKNIKIIISMRPYGFDYMHSLITLAGYDPQELEEIGEIADLDNNALKELGKYVLGDSSQELIERLIFVSKESPLVMVIGGRLLREKAINPTLLERDTDFQRAVFNRFQEIFEGNITNKIHTELCREILALISSLAPIRPQNQSFKERASAFLGVDEVKFSEAIGYLEDSGILLRRGNLVRITPDVISDHILYKACISPQERATGYGKKVFVAFPDLAPDNILRNLAELDWRATRSGKTLDLMSDIWSMLREDFQNASSLHRITILHWIEKIAFFQPSPSLALVEFAIRNPSNKDNSTKNDSIFRISHENVLWALPRIIQRIGYNPDYLPRCLDLLWMLGRNDERLLSAHPDHAIRLLCDIAGYDIGKPLIVNSTVLEAIERWLKEPGVYDFFNSPLSILQQLLAKESSTDYSKGHKIIFKPFAVNYKTTKPIRDKVISILFDSIDSGSLKAALKALKILTDALKGPHGLYSRPISTEERDHWIPEQLYIMETLKSKVVAIRDPIFILQMISDLEWFAKRASQKDIKKIAHEILSVIPETFEIKICRALWYWNDYAREGEDHVQYEKRKKQEIEDAVQASMEKFRSSDEIFRYLETILKHFKDIYTLLSRNPRPDLFCYGIAAKNPEMAFEICLQIIENPHSLLAIHFNCFIHPVRETEKDKAIAIINRAIGNMDADICRSLAGVYSGWCSNNDVDEEELKIIELLLNHPDKTVRSTALDCLKHFQSQFQRYAIDLALRFDYKEDKSLADTLCSVFDNQYGISPDLLNDEELSQLLSKLESINEIDHSLYYIDNFLGYVTRRSPSLLVDFFLKRIEKSSKKESSDDYFEAISAHGYHSAFSEISSFPDLGILLTKIRDYSLSINALSMDCLSHLFRYVSNGYCELSIEILLEWVNSKDEVKIAKIPDLLQAAHSGFIFDNIEFVSKVIEIAYDISDDCCREVSNDFYSIAISGSKSGEPGEPMPKDIKQRDSSQEAMNKYPAGSPSHRFFESLKKEAEYEIRRTIAEDEEMLIE